LRLQLDQDLVVRRLPDRGRAAFVLEGDPREAEDRAVGLDAAEALLQAVRQVLEAAVPLPGVLRHLVEDADRHDDHHEGDPDEDEDLDPMGDFNHGTLTLTEAEYKSPRSRRADSRSVSREGLTSKFDFEPFTVKVTGLARSSIFSSK